MSKIEWTEKTWNPTLGCTEVSPGCTNCYAAKMAFRLSHIPAMKEDYSGLTKKLPNGKIVWTGEVREMNDRLDDPFEYRKPVTWFVDSMSDLFHEDVAAPFIEAVFAVMALTPWHTYQVLTKRPERMLRFLSYKNREQLIFDRAEFIKDSRQGKLKKEWPLPNVWLGTSVENQKEMERRVPFLIECEAAVLFLSCEPLLGPLQLPIDCNDGSTFVDWIICGAESGTKSREMKLQWAIDLKNQSKAAGASFFMKQICVNGKKISFESFPAELQVREIPMIDASG